MEPEKRRYYFQKVFCSADGETVLRELSGFAHADEAEYCSDPRKDAYLQGRRSVIMEIRKTIREEKDDE